MADNKACCEQYVSQRNGVNQLLRLTAVASALSFPHMNVLFSTSDRVVSLCYFSPLAKMSTLLDTTESKLSKLEDLLDKSTTLRDRTSVVFVTTVIT